MALVKQRLPLTALRTFEAAARRLSFKDAADELCVSATTVSNQIRQLEKDWGCQLFVRKTRSVVLTDAGRSMALVLARAFSDIRAEIEAHVASRSKSVTLAVGPIFGARWLAPRLAQFRAAHPKIDLIIEHAPRITGLETMPTSVAVDWGVGPWNGLETRMLFRIVYAPVASPALIAAHGGLRTPEDLVRFPIIHQQNRGEWQAWLKHAGVPGLSFRDEVIATDSNMVTQAAIDGQGVALGIFPFLQPEVDMGRLIRPFEIDLHPYRAYHLLTRPGARATSEINAVCRWIEHEAALLR